MLKLEASSFKYVNNKYLMRQITEILLSLCSLLLSARLWKDAINQNFYKGPIYFLFSFRSFFAIPFYSLGTRFACKILHLTRFNSSCSNIAYKINNEISHANEIVFFVGNLLCALKMLTYQLLCENTAEDRENDFNTDSHTFG